MKNILLVGNGFDLAHGLNTRYEDFLCLVKKWSEFYKLYREVDKTGKNKVTEEEYILFDIWGCDYAFELEREKIFLRNAKNLNRNSIDELGKIIKNNSWIKYYSNCGAEIDLWVDFEREISTVLHAFNTIFQANYDMLESGDSHAVACINRNEISGVLARKVNLWEKYFYASNANNVSVKKDYSSPQYGILKKKIISDLREEFDEFVKAFEIYLQEFVCKRDDIKPLKQIQDINPEYVISFNYTSTEKLYGIEPNNVHHLHGRVRDEMKYEKSAIVMGIHEQEENNIDFIYFLKYFQRIQKGIGVKYKKFVQKKCVSSMEELYAQEYILHIYGHSLDETDADILKYLIGEIDSEGEYVLNANKVIIYYYSQRDYEQKVINLIKLYNRSFVEKNIELGEIEFVEIKKEFE